jgi:hypothetical protein
LKASLLVASQIKCSFSELGYICSNGNAASTRSTSTPEMHNYTGRGRVHRTVLI